MPQWTARSDRRPRGASNIRFGLCCTFRDQPIKFTTTTATSLAKLARSASRDKLATLCRANAQALQSALQFCAEHGIGCFRVNSQILPLKTHPLLGYDLEGLPGGTAILEQFRKCGEFARRHDLRTSFHPDQFVVLNSRRPEVVASSLLEVEYQAEVADWIGADVVNIHAGGAFGDKSQALADLARNLGRLSQRARDRVTLENDDKLFTPADLLPLCRAESIPLVYDVHHHRCCRDGLAIEEATAQAVATWNREPLFHLSSPLAGWAGPRPERHHDFIDPADLPACWRDLPITVEVEAKAKEAAVLELIQALSRPRQR